MSKSKTLYDKAKRSPNNLRFDDLCKLAETVGFQFKRAKGSHKIYKYPSGSGFMDFQNEDGKAKPYQVKQLLDFIDERLEERGSK